MKETRGAYHGWHVAPVEDRSYDGVTYHSRLESNRARELDMLFSTIAGFWRRQVKIPLGADYTTRMDFVCLEVFEPEPGEDQPTYYEWAEEVEGRKTSKHRRVRRLWKQYGPLTNGGWPIPLRVLMPRKKGGGWNTETIEREMIKETDDGK